MIKKIIFSFLSVLFVFSTVSPIYADTKSNIVVIDYNNNVSQINELLDNHDIDGVIITNLAYSSTDDTNSNKNTIKRIHHVHYDYRCTNVKNGSDYTGKAIIGKTSGQPGTTISLSVNKSLSATSSTSCSISDSIITAAVGFDITKSYGISHSASANVPSKVNGKKVKTMTLSAYPIYKTKNFTIQRRAKIVTTVYSWKDYGTGNARKPYGIYFSKSYSYK